MKKNIKNLVIYIHICIFVVTIPTTLPIRTAPSGGFSIFIGFDNLQKQAYEI